jgi:hypothetical protein
MGITSGKILDLRPILMHLGGVGHENETLEKLKTARDKNLIGKGDSRGQRIWGLRSKPAEDK